MMKKIVDMATDELCVFLNSSKRNSWLYCDLVEIYVRKGAHNINKRLINTLDIASITIQPEQCGNGLGMSIINDFHDKNPFEVTYIESILNKRFYKHLKKCGWIDVEFSNPPCVYKTR